MSTGGRHEFEVTVVGAGVVGCATALALARRGVAVALLEAEPEPGLGASGTNSGILHTGFDSTPGELETDMILASARLRDPVIDALGVPVLRCGAVMRGVPSDKRAELVDGARRNGVEVIERDDGGLGVPGEAVTDPAAYTIALATAAARHGTQLLMRSRVEAVESDSDALTLRTAPGEAIGTRLLVNCAGLHADLIARLAGDESFEIYPRKGEFLVFDLSERLEQILLPVPTERTKGVLVFPTVDGKVIAGPTAVDLNDKRDWSVRPEATEEIMSKAAEMHPPLRGAEPIEAYAGLRPAGRRINYLIARSGACARLINVAAIRSTGLTASLGIAERVTEIVASLGVTLGPERELEPGPAVSALVPWWRRAAA